ncbi:enoyl-CoA hydratase/isomerase family protein [Panacibacter sp. DH6]|uniref:Enoyl-CoA hydratase/isomerase family protein n=1 Tax=Panacibacter microcysteis TaxID=2793269 RepID=A0A931GYF8_9BACT|nr:enoyl-CoA hydratase/isomerase family protein [Panacibacter microcysteis]MBG9375777.1 enoyl-CoA hydratase/isomerase family protein [Panacibacter microcysteis]
MIQEIKEGYVKIEREHGISTIEFYHPQSNALPGKILETLAHDIHSEGLDTNIKVIVLRSAGEKTFCAGASFDELAAINTQEEGIRFFSGFAAVINAMRKCPKLIIARIHGKCVGGGVGLAAAADYAIAAEGADIKLSELSVGIGPFVVGPAVERKMGTSAFSQIAIDATMWRPADWARRKGLYAELHGDVSGMDDSIARLSSSLSHYSTEAIKELKKILWRGTEHWDDLLKERAAISGKLILSEYAKEFIRKFKNKEKVA